MHLRAARIAPTCSTVGPSHFNLLVAQPRETLALLRAAVKLQPDFWVAHTNIQNALMLLGDEEGAWRDGEDMRAAAGGRPGRAREYNYGNWDYLTWNLRAWLDERCGRRRRERRSGDG